jgi:phage-related protein
MLREVLARFGIEFDGAALQAGIGGLQNLAIAAAAAAVALGVGLLVALRNLTVEMAEFGDEAAKTARQLGISGDELLRWRFAAERAGEGVDTAVRAFSDLDVEFRDAEGGFREIEDILPEIADGFAALESDTQRSARAQQLFGRSGAELLPFFENGSEGLQELSDRFDELTGGSFGNFFQRAEEAQDAMADFELASTAVKAALATELLPVLTEIVGGVSDFVGFLNNATRGTRPFRAALLLLATAIGSVAAVIGFVLLPVILQILPFFLIWAAAIATVVLVVDDLLTLFEGGDSVIGRFLDEMFGIGTAARVAAFVQRAWAAFIVWIRTQAIPFIQRLGRELVALWPRVRPVLRAIGRGLVRAFRFLVALPGRVQRIVAAITGFFSSLAARVTAIANQIRSVVSGITSSVQNVAGFLGIDIGGEAPGVSAPGASVSPDRRGGDTVVDQTNEIQINGTDLSAEELQRTIVGALEEQRQRALRVAERALTTVAG